MSRGGRGGFGRGGGATLCAFLFDFSTVYCVITGRGFGRGGGPPRDTGPPDTVFGAYPQPATL